MITVAAQQVALFLINGFEETEALCTVDILRRAGIDVTTVSLGASRSLTGRSRITVEADAMFDDISGKTFDMLVIPGGTTDYAEHEGLLELVREQNENGGNLAAICAAPCVFGKLGLLEGKRAVIYPGMEKLLGGAVLSPKIVETDGNVTTAKGAGVTVYFALRLVEILAGREIADSVAEKFIAVKISV